MCAELPSEAAAREFESYVDGQWRQLLRSAWLLTGNWAAAEDLVQSTLARVWTRWSLVRAVTERDAYVRRILTNQFLGLERLRSSAELPIDVLPETPSPDATARSPGRPAGTHRSS
jgi:DNA-directed RNA polymerase specialized sigma24 family protein